MRCFINISMVLLFFCLQTHALYAETKKPEKLEIAEFAAGCFWGTEEFFRKIPGVMKTEVGYAGGTTENPKYDEMHDERTGHAETVKLEFDPNKVSYTTLLEQF